MSQSVLPNGGEYSISTVGITGYRTQGRTTLLGDACHPTLAFLRQGAVIAIEDAYAVAACLSKCAKEPMAALGRYQNISHRSRYAVRLSSHPPVSLLTNGWTRERSHSRSSIASVVQSPFLKFPLLLPRGAPGLSPPWSRHRALPRIAGHSHGEPARVFVFAPQRGARLRFPSRVSTSWSMGLSANFCGPRQNAETLTPASVGVPIFVRPVCAVRSRFSDLSEGQKQASCA